MICDTIKVKKGLTAIVGSGGKTSLMYRLADELSSNNKVVVCTTTQIFIPEHIITLINPKEEDIKFAFEYNNCICVGNKNKAGKLEMSEISTSILLKHAEYVLVEADGSRGLPLKAHEYYEPVIPENCVETICVLGITGIGNMIKEVCHRPRIYSDILKAGIYDYVTPEMVAKVLNYEGFGDLIIINQAENDEDFRNSKIIASYLDKPVFAGEVRKGKLLCLQ